MHASIYDTTSELLPLNRSPLGGIGRRSVLARALIMAIVLLGSSLDSPVLSQKIYRGIWHHQIGQFAGGDEQPEINPKPEIDWDEQIDRPQPEFAPAQRSQTDTPVPPIRSAVDRQKTERESSESASIPQLNFAPTTFEKETTRPPAVSAKRDDESEIRETNQKNPRPDVPDSPTDSEFGWVEPFDPPNPRDNPPDGTPHHFREISDARPLIPATPDQNSFTADCSPIVGEPIEQDHGASEWNWNAPLQASSEAFGNSASPSNSIRNAQDGLERGRVETAGFNDANAGEWTNSKEISTEQAQRLIARYDLTAVSRSIPGRPIKLMEMVRQPIPLGRRAEMIGQYWDTWSKWSEMNSRLEYSNWLDQVSKSQSQRDSGLLNAARSLAENQVLAAKTDFSKSQTALRGYLPIQTHHQGQPPLPPVPADTPLIHRYVTHYQLYRQYRTMPARFQSIDQEMNQTLQLIVAQAATVELAQEAAENQVQQLKSGQSSLSSVLDAGRIWRAAERELIQTVAKYNRMIADYSLNVTDGRQTPETVVAMLIGHPGRLHPDQTDENSSPLADSTKKDQMRSGSSLTQPQSVVEPFEQGITDRNAPPATFENPSRRSWIPSESRSGSSELSSAEKDQPILPPELPVETRPKSSLADSPASAFGAESNFPQARPQEDSVSGRAEPPAENEFLPRQPAAFQQSARPFGGLAPIANPSSSVPAEREAAGPTTGSFNPAGGSSDLGAGIGTSDRRRAESGGARPDEGRFRADFSPLNANDRGSNPSTKPSDDRGAAPFKPSMPDFKPWDGGSQQKQD